MLTLILQATTKATLQAAALIFNSGITELLFYKNGNMAPCSTDGRTAAMCGFGNTDCV